MSTVAVPGPEATAVAAAAAASLAAAVRAARAATAAAAVAVVAAAAAADDAAAAWSENAKRSLPADGNAKFALRTCPGKHHPGIEAQETVEEERPSETHVFAAAERSLGSLEAELESHQDETRSLASLTEPTSLLEGRRVTRFDETSTLEADLEVVNEEETGRNVLQDLFADEPWRLQLCGDAFGELKQLGSTQQKVVLEVLKTLASGTWPELWKKEVGKPQGEQTSMCYR